MIPTIIALMVMLLILGGMAWFLSRGTKDADAVNDELMLREFRRTLQVGQVFRNIHGVKYVVDYINQNTAHVNSHRIDNKVMRVSFTLTEVYPVEE